MIVDTTVWIDYLRGVCSPQTSWLERELPRQRLGILDLSLCEVSQGIREERQIEDTLATILKLKVYQIGGIEVATSAARNFQTLSRRASLSIKRLTAGLPHSVY